MDGGYCANNPTLYGLADAVIALNKPADELRVLSVGVGMYPEPKQPWQVRLAHRLDSVQLLQKTLNINTNSMEQLRNILFGHIRTMRVSDSFTTPEMATDLLEHNLDKLNVLYQRGRESYGRREAAIKQLLLS
jgi:predicted patatin/cPLA2 family phospholipase